MGPRLSLQRPKQFPRTTALARHGIYIFIHFHLTFIILLCRLKNRASTSYTRRFRLYYTHFTRRFAHAHVSSACHGGVMGSTSAHSTHKKAYIYKKHLSIYYFTRYYKIVISDTEIDIRYCWRQQPAGWGKCARFCPVPLPLPLRSSVLQ
jgi:hypothetical protein